MNARPVPVSFLKVKLSPNPMVAGPCPQDSPLSPSCLERSLVHSRHKRNALCFYKVHGDSTGSREGILLLMEQLHSPRAPFPLWALGLAWTFSAFCVCVYIVFVFNFFWLYHATCGILVPRPGIEPGPPAVEAWSPNHWTAREVPGFFLLMEQCPQLGGWGAHRAPHPSLKQGGLWSNVRIKESLGCRGEVRPSGGGWGLGSR